MKLSELKSKLMKWDKATHFLWCFFLSSVWLPLGIILGVGIEIYDYVNYGRKMKMWEFIKMSAGDLVADVLGVIICGIL